MVHAASFVDFIMIFEFDFCRQVLFEETNFDSRKSKELRSSSSGPDQERKVLLAFFLQMQEVVILKICKTF